MPIIKKSFGKNYLQCYESEKGKTYSCEQIRKSWDNKVNYVTENSLNNTKEEAQKEFVDAFILRLLSEKKLWKIAHANIVDSAGNITDGRAMLDKLSSPLVLENINTILKNNPVLLETWQTISLEDILGKAWQEDGYVLERTVDVHITRLRKKLGAFGKHIANRSVDGYCLEC